MFGCRSIVVLVTYLRMAARYWYLSKKLFNTDYLQVTILPVCKKCSLRLTVHVNDLVVISEFNLFYANLWFCFWISNYVPIYNHVSEKMSMTTSIYSCQFLYCIDPCDGQPLFWFMQLTNAIARGYYCIDSLFD